MHIWRIFLLSWVTFSRLVVCVSSACCVSVGVCACVYLAYTCIGALLFLFILIRLWHFYAYCIFSLFSLTVLVISWLPSHSSDDFFLRVYTLRVSSFSYSLEQGSREDPPKVGFARQCGFCSPFGDFMSCPVPEFTASDLCGGGVDLLLMDRWSLASDRCSTQDRALWSPFLPEAASLDSVSLKQLLASVSTTSLWRRKILAYPQFASH